MAGGILSLGIAVGETCIQFSGLKDCCGDFWSWVFDRVKDCCACFYGCIIPKKGGCCATYIVVILGSLCELCTVVNNWVLGDWKNHTFLLVMTILLSIVYGFNHFVALAYFFKTERSLKMILFGLRQYTTFMALFPAIHLIDIGAEGGTITYGWAIFILKIWCDVIFIFKAKP